MSPVKVYVGCNKVLFWAQAVGIGFPSPDKFLFYLYFVINCWKIPLHNKIS